MAGKYISLRYGRFSQLIDKKAVRINIVLLLLFLTVAIISLGLGDYVIRPFDALKAVFAKGDAMQNLVVRNFRMPRIVLAALAGMALAVSGAILQGLVRNPLASPDIIGVTDGAALATVGFLALFNTSDNAMTVSIEWLPLASFLGALGVAWLVHALAKKGYSTVRLVLIGTGIAALAKALTQFLMVTGPIYLASRANIWITGSVNGAKWNQDILLLVWFVFFFTVSLWLARRLNAHELGEGVAAGIGVALRGDRTLLIIAATALAGGAVAFSGGIGFVGLMAPHMARRLVGSGHGALLPTSALFGGIIVMISDLAGRMLFLPLEIPAGVFTSAIGAPYFIYLLYKSRGGK